ncbi:MAG: NADH-quinone oxidoreductase subunit C, partial [Lachnospiraceae bacterium]|nr:NADH-quinone oxidoreductase subunit C [Lachnospiraceae bacterium]
YSLGDIVRECEVRGEHVLPTSSGIYDQAAAWPEREINELMDISFDGLDTSERLFMPDNLLEGKGQILVTPISEIKKENGLD